MEISLDGWTLLDDFCIPVSVLEFPFSLVECRLTPSSQATVPIREATLAFHLGFAPYFDERL